MKRTPSSLACAALAAGVALPATRAGEPLPHPNRLSFAARAAFNVRATFHSSLPAPTTQPGPSAGGGVLRTYDNGFVGVDSRNNADGQTWFWGYIDAAQVNAEADTVTFGARASTAPATSGERDEDASFGGELTYTRTLFEWGRAFWGLELGANYTPVSIEDNAALRGSAEVIRDAFALGGAALPPPPYIGSYSEPGPLIGDAPVRTTVATETVYAGRREIEATTFGFRLGPVLDVPMGEPLSLQLSGGAYLMYSDTEFKYAETATVTGLPARSLSGKVDAQDWTLGAYVRGQVLVSLSSRLGIFAGAEYLMLDKVELGAGTHLAKLDFGESFAAFLGVAVNF
jgi:hypothetical protein